MHSDFDLLAAGQHGLITNAQLDERGVPSSTRFDWVRAKRLHVVHEGVFRTAGSPVTFEQCCLAATLAGAPDCHLSHRAAAQMWEMHDFGGVIDVIVARNRLPRLKGVSVHRSRDLDRFHMPRVRHRIPITPPALTLLDLGAVVDWWLVKEAMEQAFVTKVVTPKGLQAAYEIVARPGRRGAGVIRRLLENRSLGSTPADAKSEVKFADLCEKFGLPRPVFHFAVYDDNAVFVAEPDFAYPDRKIRIEIDSVSIHGTADALQSDLERQNKLVNLGWTVLRFSWHDLVYRPEYVVRTVQRCLGA
ncbi:MAG TPA: DUF559 domain-containing protein [Acidimicrobiales bacterium]|nr:DUF559 domain-containing protein [Acidimicrobiales bacterium]